MSDEDEPPAKKTNLGSGTPIDFIRPKTMLQRFQLRQQGSGDLAGLVGGKMRWKVRKREIKHASNKYIDLLKELDHFKETTALRGAEYREKAAEINDKLFAMSPELTRLGVREIKIENPWLGSHSMGAFYPSDYKDHYTEILQNLRTGNDFTHDYQNNQFRIFYYHRQGEDYNVSDDEN